MSKTYQVVGIGNAMVDVLSHTSDEFLAANGVEKGIMQLIDLTRASELYAQVGPAIEISGGSAANTIAGIALLGGRTAYVGKVRDDQLGAIFAHDLRAQGADYDTALAPADAAGETGRCFVLVTPDGERSMNTYLGVTEFLTPGDIDAAQMADTDWIYLEGYRFDGPQSHEAFAKAIAACKGGGGRVSLTLSDPFCVERHREAFRAMIRTHVDLLFCNRAEVMSMYQAGDHHSAMRAAAAEVAIRPAPMPRTALLPRSQFWPAQRADAANGAFVWAESQCQHVPATKARVVDATGAGDLFAGGFLWGLTHGHNLQVCGAMGCAAAGEIIGHIGARPAADLISLFADAGLL